MSSSLRCRFGLHDWVAIGRRTDKVRVFPDLDVTEEHVYGIDRCRRCDRLREVELHYPPLTVCGEAQNRRYPVKMSPPPPGPSGTRSVPVSISGQGEPNG